MSAQRWSAIAQSEFDWEREALAFLRDHCPDIDPWHVWSNFEFLDDQGRVNEVDALVLSPRGLFLVEIKSRPGRVDGDAHSWTWKLEGRSSTYDNPFLLANRKAKRLKGLLQRQAAFQRAHIRVPFVTAFIFLSAERIDISALPPAVVTNVFLRGRPDSGRDDGIIAGLSGAVGPAKDWAPNPDTGIRRVIKLAMEEAGIRPSLRHRRIGDYELGRLMEEGQGYQDFEGKHVSVGVRRRIRIFQTPPGGKVEDVQKAVAREFQILEGISHTGILRANDFKDTERGPALIFDYDPRSMRFDFLLKDKTVVDRLDVDQRLHLIRQLAEIIRFAHEKKLTHRALAPQTILVRDPAERLPRLQVMNWQLATREAGSTGGTAQQTLGTAHIEDHVDDPSKVYLAPESLHEIGLPILADVFSLGTIAYHLFTGQPPATSSVELVGKLRQGQGLLVADVMDGAAPSLVDLIRSATHPDVSRRLDSVDEFLNRLVTVEKDLSPHAMDDTVDPSVAKAGDSIEGGFKVVKRLGRGSTADALLVHGEGTDEHLVLKVAADPVYNDRLVAEGDVLASLNHQNIVRHRSTLSVSGRTALLMESAGNETLAGRLRVGERPSLDLARRWGEDLITAVDYLDEQGVAHRDIKPDNIGIRSSRTGRLHLVLFDFSLSKGSLDNIHAGTRPYLDPFLSLRRPPRWDLHAERFAVAVTLYEMMTGSIPVWGDGNSDPAVLDCEATLEPERFDPQVREGMVAFFARALRRLPAERFDNAEDMLRTWRQVFNEAASAPVVVDQFDIIARRVTAQTPVAELGFGIEALDVLTRMGVETVRQLLAVPRIQYRHQSGVGDRIRKEIRLKAKQLAHLRPELVPGGSLVQDDNVTTIGPTYIDRIAKQLLPRRPAGDETPEDSALAAYLGLEGIGEPWPSLGVAAAHAGLSRVAMADALRQARIRWQDKSALTEIRLGLARLLEQEGQVVTVVEAARTMLLQHGAIELDEAERLRMAQAVVRAAVEAEESLAEPRFRWMATKTVPLLASNGGAVAAAIVLGEAADDLAGLDPLPSVQRVRERLEETLGSEQRIIFTPQRLIRLAVAVSARAALSTKQEIYPRGMAAEQAIRLALSSLIGPSWLTREQIIDRVKSRYPEASDLPSRPTLDDLLRTAGADLEWREDGAWGPAGYYSQNRGFDPSSSAGSLSRLQTTAPPVEESPDVLDAVKFEERVGRVVAERGFLALSVAPRRSLAAAGELERRFGLARLSIDALLLKAMKAEAEANEIAWLTVRETDSVGPGGGDWSHLKRLAAMAWPSVDKAIRGAAGPVLLTDVGLIGRYDLIGRLDVLRGDCGTAKGPPGLIVLIPMPLPSIPSIDGIAVPAMASQWAVVPEAWLANMHRAGRAA